jgi:hypothetical protein
MNSILRFLTLALLSVIFFQCQKEVIDSFGTTPPVSGTDPITTALQGNVLDENSKPAMGVTVQVGNKTTTTNARGYFRIPAAALDKNASLVVAEKAGYFKAYRSFAATSGTNQVVIKLVKKTVSGTVDAASGGEVTLGSGAKVALPANGIVQASNGSAYTGTVNVYAAYIDPTANDIAQVVPGSFMADDKNNHRVTLESYGMMAVELQSPSGQKLQVKSGLTATLTTPIPASVQASAPATIALWYVDEQTGIWKEEGTATKSGNNYVGTVKHFSFWNCDGWFSAITLSLTLKTNEGVPLVHTAVRIKRTVAGGVSQSYGYTDSLGQVSGLVPMNESLVLDVLDVCNNSVYSQNIGPFTQNSNLGILTIPSTTAGLVTVKGKLVNCSGAPVSNGYAIIYYNNGSYYAATDASGNFSRSFTQCSSTPASAQILGTDATSQQQGSMVNVTVTSPVTNAGSINACGTSTLQYINYNLNDTLHAISSLVGDTVMAYPDSLQGSTGAQFYGYHGATSDYIQFRFNATGTGTFPMLGIMANNRWAASLIQPFNVVITSYPLSPGQFWEGTFTGQFKEQNNNTHTITGSFRIRK